MLQPIPLEEPIALPDLLVTIRYCIDHSGFASVSFLSLENLYAYGI